MSVTGWMNDVKQKTSTLFLYSLYLYSLVGFLPVVSASDPREQQEQSNNKVINKPAEMKNTSFRGKLVQFKCG